MDENSYFNEISKPKNRRMIMMKIKKFIAGFLAAVLATSTVSIISVPADDNDQPLSSGTITLEDEGNWWTELYIDGSTWLGELDLYDIDPSTGYIEFYIDTDNNTGVGYDSYEVQSTDEETGEDSYFKMVSFEDGGLVVNISDVNTDNYYFIVWTSSTDVTTYSINWTLYGEYRSNESELAELQALIAEAYEIDADEYTEDKYAALLEAIAAAEEIDDTDYCSVTKAAKEALQAAIDGLDGKLNSGTITLEDEGNWWTELYIDEFAWLEELSLYDIDPSTGYIEFYIDTDNNTGVGYSSYEVQSTDEETGEDSTFKKVNFEDGGLVVNLDDIDTSNYYFIVWTSSTDVTSYSINWTLYGEYRSNESDLAELQALIAEAYEIDADEYTEDKYAALLEAIAAAEEIDDTDYCSVTKAAKEALQAAIDGLNGKLNSGTITLKDEGNGWTELYIDESTWLEELSLYDIDPTTGYIEFWIDTDNNTGIGYNDYEVQSTDEETGEDSYFKTVSFEGGYLVVSTGCVDTENYWFIVWASSDDVATYNIYWQVCGEYRSNESELAELQALIAQAYELEADDYTEDTYAALLKAIAAAEKIDDTDYCTVTEAAKETLQAAIDGLVKFTIGDANLDGNIDYLDAMTVLRADAELIELTDEQITAADVNGDGSVDSLDAILILRYDAGLIESFE